jgi:uncharacterized protein YndB with AHSA1/START domain
MFGLFKPKLAPVGPHAFEIEGEIEASAADVFALIDYADPRNAMRARGARVEAVEGNGRRFLMKLPQVPDLDFHIDVIEAEAPNHYAYAIVIDPLVGRMAASTESYTIWDVPGGGCRVRLENVVTFQEGLREKHIQEEFALVTLALFKTIAKLKLQAEQGVEAVLAFEEQQSG